MAITIAIPGIYQDVQEVVASNVDFVELNFADLRLRNVLRIRARPLHNQGHKRPTARS